MGEEVAAGDEEVREDTAARTVLQGPEEVQETGGELLPSPHGVTEPDRRDVGRIERQKVKLKGAGCAQFVPC